ncbi:MAG: hypothetical protein IPG07_17685 [Crocinitomicaceae bacterium]|nr:hypothetical protein [Crocinitomicaceae bacterium]
MKNLPETENHIHIVSSFEDLVLTSFQGSMNAICWKRELKGDFSEIVNKIELDGNITEIDPENLLELQLNEEGQLAREILLNDFNLLKEYSAAPALNVIKHYDRDEAHAFFPTDVYSFHVDRSPIPGATFLCTYYGAPSEIITNAQVQQKIRVPEIRNQLEKLYTGSPEGFESFLSEHFFDLHYQPLLNAQPISLGLGHLWRLAIDHPESKVLPCVHRAPVEKDGELRLLMIC